ncbi:MAG: FAD-binding oxidoreductase, partial [Buchnera aphidicola]|nr:ferredoxin--NADP(+) reductase [Buchnera aphidicola]MDE5285770.1 FAD-binding oxidoreductase [Buchnera aphidicola]
KISSFDAGQFTQLSLYDPSTKKKITRAYSYVNAPSDKKLEFYIIRVKNGKLSNLLYNLKQNDKIFIKKKSSGFFTLNEIPSCKFLWMFATGTAIGPYLSILQEGKNINKFKKIILIHAVRYYCDLSYLPLMKQLE